MIRIRPCAPGDEEALSLVGQATFLETFAGILPGSDIVTHCRVQHAASVYRSWIDGGAHLWLAEADPSGAPLGYLVLAAATLPVEHPRADDLEVKRIYLLRQYHGQGIGKRLMAEAIRCATQAGASRLLLGVYSRNDAAVAFYEHLGFQRVGNRWFRVGEHDYDDFVMALALPRRE